MPGVQICFIDSGPASKCKKEQALQRAKALSHAARVSYSRRPANIRDRAKVSIPLQQQDGSQGNKNFKLPPHKKTHHSIQPWDDKIPPYEDDSEDEDWKRLVSLAHDPGSDAWSLHEDLDPFLRLSGPTSRKERDLLHYYLFTSPSAIYGVQPGTIYCPIRDITVRQIQENNIWLQWTLLSAEMSALGQSAAERALTVLTRRSYIYRHMNSLIAKPDLRCSDATITGLCFAGLIESRIGSVDSARRHLGVVRHGLIPERGGIQEIAEYVSKPICCIIIWVGLEFHAFENWHALDSAVTTFVQIMSAIGKWMAQLPVHGKLSPMPSQTKEHIYASSSFDHFLKNHEQLFNPKSPLHRFIGPSCFEGVNSSSIQIRSHIAVLWVMNKILWELRDDITNSAEFLESFYRWILSSDDPTPFGFGRTARPNNTSILKTLTIVGMIGYCSASFVPKKDPAAIDWTSGGKMDGNRHILRWWEAIDMLELVHLLSDQSRHRVLCQMSAWLIGPEAGQCSTMLTRDDLEDLGDEMRLAWLDMIRKRHLRTKGKK